ncbi:MAG: mannose-6-phosphate isomerase [Bacteroidetes bacterium MedPE-SWsnd-G2]|nr:MAG: mannose-6-phosphate isomerase [Bacteroidetes bacterium MedPE-SWsnd-G2]
MIKLYPLKFSPILKSKIWGGEKLISKLGKQSGLTNIGESWEISDVKGDVSIVSNGPLKGSNLKSLLGTYESDFVGAKNFKQFGLEFPLLIKFIDAKTPLSIQLHPNDKLAAQRHNSFGKTEMWHVVQADSKADLIVGFNRPMTKEVYLKHLSEKTLPSILNFEPVKEGDTFFIEVGRIHAIGAGVLLAEIQQTSDITYRVYDWDRVDENGNERELHNDLAIDAFNFELKNDYKVSYAKDKNRSNEMVSCSYFTTNYLKLDKPKTFINNKDSFVIYMCVEGKANIVAEDFSEELNMGETILVPAGIKNYEISTQNATLLEVYV